MPMFEPRKYRNIHTNSKLDSFTVQYLETDLWIGIDHGFLIKEMIDFSIEKIKELRTIIIGYSVKNKDFIKSIVPIEKDSDAHEIVQEMISYSKISETGPMSGVAGAFSFFVGKQLKEKYKLNNVIVENGGDNYLDLTDIELNVSIFVGKSPLSDKVGLKILPEQTPIGICTSSGILGHSFSFGRADAVTVICKNIILADCFATAICNKISNAKDIDGEISKLEVIPEIESCIIIKNDKLGIKSKHEVLFY